MSAVESGAPAPPDDWGGGSGACGAAGLAAKGCAVSGSTKKTENMRTNESCGDRNHRTVVWVALGSGAGVGA